jgi:hypothetical protein
LLDLAEKYRIPIDMLWKPSGGIEATLSRRTRAASRWRLRYLMPVADYDEAGAVTDPDTGLTFGYLRYTETSSNRILVTVEGLYGFKKAIGDGLKRIVKP